MQSIIKLDIPSLKIKDTRKLSGICSNLVQILYSMQNMQFVENLALYKDIVRVLKKISGEFNLYLSSRDVAELVEALVRLKFKINPNNDTDDKDKDKDKVINFEKELRLLAKKSALELGNMNPKSRAMVVTNFEKIDFYDKDLTDAMKRLKMLA